MIVTPLLLALVFTQDPDPAGWRYFVPAPGADMEHPGPLALPLGPEASQDVEVRVELTGRALHGELRYGDAGSRRIAVMIDERAPGDADLYLDIDRDRFLEPEEKVALVDGRWVVDVPVENEDERGVVVHVPRRMVFTLGERGGVFAATTMGYLEGRVTLGGRSVAARRVDGDANGFFTDPRDQLWLDLNDDGRFSPLDELWLFAPLLELAGQRYALRSDRLGADLQVDLVEGVGSISLDLSRIAGGADQVRRLNVLLVGRDGSAIGVRALGAPVEVPVGDYRLGMVTLSMVDPGGGAEWSFVFSDVGGERERTWFTVERDGTAVIDPVGELRFEDGFARGLEQVSPGEELRGSPALYTEQGLLINTAYRGLNAPRWGFQAMSARVRLESDGGALLDEASSGFA